MTQQKYPESPRISADYLRQALPLMNKLGVAVNPSNYTVFYNYIAGKNSKLNDEIDAFLESGERLTRSQSEILFKKHFDHFDETKVDTFQKKSRNIIAQIIKAITLADSSACQYGNELEGYGTRLEDDPDEATIQKLINGLLSSTQTMQRSNQVLQQQLKDATNEVENLKKALQTAQEEAVTDTLTGLTNRAGFTKAMKNAIKQNEEESSSLCLLMIDIDHFKKINDKYGHLFGDTVLKMVGAVLNKCVKGKDTACRYGGEEFAILLPETPLDGAKQLAETIRKAIEKGKIQSSSSEEPVGNITVSVGVAKHILNESIAHFIERTDNALYASKGNGRNLVTVAE